ncbi:N-6 DNA methylase [Pediococcus acidilactici]|nr:N-6 DNA methylase [Pediococcus acidilactici]UWF34187.1 N-6 DNA methylase [Pediococcus acidilactici]
MNESKLLANERSEGGELIVEMNLLFNRYNWGMKSAVGELSLKTEFASDNRNGTLFPDAVIFADNAKSEALMGWEFKMPDVSINDDELYENALDKANRMGTQAFVLWNFQYVAIYIKENGKWSSQPTKFFNDYADKLVSRKSVHENEDLWKKQLFNVLVYLNNELIAEKFESAPIEFNIGNYISTIADVLTPAVAVNYLQSSDTELKARMRKWRRTEQAELTLVKENEPDVKIANSFARNVVIRWVNRIIFAHLLRDKQNIVNDILVHFSNTSDIHRLTVDLNSVVEKTDFYTIFHVNKYEDRLPGRVTASLNEFNKYLANTDFSKMSRTFVSQLLESVISVTTRELMGLYTTPPNLAKLLVSLTVKNADGNFADITTGSGTIAHTIQNLLRNYSKSEEYIHDHIWASDRYGYPLQIANLNLTTSDSLNLKNIVFQHNALDLKIGEKISIVNPSTGMNENIEIPAFNYIISNLPFVGSNNRNEEDQGYINAILEKYSELDDKIDLYQAIILHLETLLSKEDSARIGVIVSNSWTKVQRDYKSFFKVLNSIFDIEFIIQPLRGRWFQNAKVVANILILKRKSKERSKPIRFIMIKNGLTSPDKYGGHFGELLDDIKLGEQNDLYIEQQIDASNVIEKINLGISVEAMFDNLDWIDEFKTKMAPLNRYLEGGRGTRTGGDQLFIMKNQNVDETYMIPYLKTIQDVQTFEINKTEYFYFYLKDDMQTLKQKGMYKTIKYLETVKNSKIAISRKKKLGDKWFNADQAPKYADFITSINPQNRYFWSRINAKIAVNQRVTAFKIKEEYAKDIESLHALLNSLPVQYMLAASGFGRGQGVTDLTKDGIMQIYIPSLDELNFLDKKMLIKAWQKVKLKPVPTVEEQVYDPDWIEFNRIVFNLYKVDFDNFKKMSRNLLELLERRASAKNIVG